ncbi:MAG TPA: hypothetical protein VGF99_07255 [Myxococcota bacterium]
MSPTITDARPAITPAIEALLHQLVAVTPQLAGVVVDDIVVVGLGAHGSAVASVRELRGQAASVTIAGRRRRIELGLRPDFFLEGDAARRTATLMHELLHLDPTRPGRLLDEARHSHRPHAAHDKLAQTLTRVALSSLSPTAALCLAHDGEVRLRSWRRRPIETTARRRFDDDDVFDAIVRVCTPADRRGGWW